MRASPTIKLDMWPSKLCDQEGKYNFFAKSGFHNIYSPTLHQAGNIFFKLVKVLSNHKNVSDYGDSDVFTLVDLFRSALESADVNCDDIELEWIKLKSLMYQR